MASGRTVRCLVWLLVTACAQMQTAHSQSIPSQGRVPMVLQGVHPVVEVRVKDETLRMVVDTGADQNVISAKAAAKLGLVPSSQTLPGRGAAGAFSAVPWVHLDTVAIGDVQLREQIAFIVPLPEEANADGVLGIPLFKDFVVTLDYAAGKLELEAPKRFRPAARLEALPLHLEAGKIFVKASAAGVDGWYSLDTGAGNAVTMFTPTVERAHLRGSFGAALSMVTGISPGGYTRGELVRVPEVRIGPHRFERVIVELSLADQGYFAHPLPDTQGNLGGELWRRFSMTIDLPSRRLYLRPNTLFAQPFAATRSGLVAQREADSFKVIDVVAATPAAGAGLIVGDSIVAIDGREASTWTQSAFRDLLGGAPGTSIAFDVVGKDGRKRDVSLVLKDLL
ncbi:MAG: aspartyl protease family protein [Rudaea sp.]|uniref:aspartyl protease family protein n=1 Tax=Rudaea sp. 3F27F6 TaxID=2502208 RepID=UPI0010F578AA|nr:aspartyl protease family protein [Rudaea sp. 3F27F6]MBN8886214.1 aspartyl protease family protein [Rudaea sp.]MBR0345566.1 aspartyl protease family protein [Rudaea sp.]